MLDTCTLAVFGLMNRDPGDLGVGPARGQQHQDLPLALGQPEPGQRVLGRRGDRIGGRVVQAQPGPPGQGGGFRRDRRRADPAGQGVGLADATADGLPVARRRGRLGQP